MFLICGTLVIHGNFACEVGIIYHYFALETFFLFINFFVQDHIERGNVDFSSLKFRVLDEADEMLRMGFVEDVEYIPGNERSLCIIVIFNFLLLLMLSGNHSITYM